MRPQAYALAIAAVLVACSSLPAGTQGANTPASVAPSSPPPASAQPQIRAGRWSNSLRAAGLQTNSPQCVTDPDMNHLISNLPAGCTSANGFQRAAEGWVSEAECRGERGLDHIRVVVNGDLQSHYIADATMTGAGISSPMQIHVEGTYQGACRGDE